MAAGVQNQPIRGSPGVLLKRETCEVFFAKGKSGRDHDGGGRARTSPAGTPDWQAVPATSAARPISRRTAPMIRRISEACTGGEGEPGPRFPPRGKVWKGRIRRRMVDRGERLGRRRRGPLVDGDLDKSDWAAVTGRRGGRQPCGPHFSRPAIFARRLLLLITGRSFFFRQVEVVISSQRKRRELVQLLLMPRQRMTCMFPC